MVSIVGIATVLSLIAPMMTTVMTDSTSNLAIGEEPHQDDNISDNLTPEDHMILFGDYPISLEGYEPVAKT